MIKSMTGYGRAEGGDGERKYSVEVKTINSKQFDLQMRMPGLFKEKELELRTFLLQHLERGKVELTIQIDASQNSDKFTINKALAHKYFDEINELQHELHLDEKQNLVDVILRLPDVVQPTPELLADDEWHTVQAVIDTATERCDISRQNEGRLLKADFEMRIGLIQEYLGTIETYEIARIERIREKLRKEVEKYFETQNIDQNRFEQEIIYYLEKIDITEEKVRLKKHCDYFNQTLEQDTTSNGKKLNFITQEVGREINTIGSKASDYEIQRLVVQMKDELEKVKEQLFNIL
ncbi:MAG: YicC family protein [Clostridia bacterium]|nr:YicC family protein [Clostridia bacterium]